MAETLLHAPDGATREEKYTLLLPQLKNLVQGETDWIANLSNLMAALKEGLGFFWVGVYFVKAEELVLGPFQGPVACTRIAFGKGVCGTAWKEGRTLVVPDVEEFPGHIACSSLSRSEIVVPVWADHRVVMVLDVDSTLPDDFSEADVFHLQEVAALISTLYTSCTKR